MALDKQPKNQPNRLNQKNKLALFLILALALLVRLYKINTPLADWHSWRQADTASVAVEYTKNGINLLQPSYHDLSDIPSGQDNPNGYRMVEFPLINADVAWMYQALPFKHMPLHVFYRLYSIIFSLFSIFLLYKIVQLFDDQKTALLAAAVFAFLPYNIFYSRTVLPEIPLVFFSLAALYSLSRYFLQSDHNITTPWYWIAIITSAIALLLKPMAIFFALPALYVGFQQKGIKLFLDKKIYLFVVLVFLPLVMWRSWIAQFPEGIPAFDWLLNGNGIRFKGAFFRWIFADRIGRLILGYWGILLLGLGLLAKSKTKFYAWWLLGILSYLTIFATGNVQHDYYQIIIIPILAIYVAKGIAFLIDAPKKNYTSKPASYAVLFSTVAFTLAFSWYEVRGYYNINNPAIVAAGQAVDQLTPTDALVIAPYGGDTAFLYQTNRRGWPIGGSIEKRIEQGADYYVTTALDDEAKQLMQRYQVIESNDQFTLIQLISQNSSQSPDPIPNPTPIVSPQLATPSPTPDSSPRIPPGQQKKLR